MDDREWVEAFAARLGVDPPTQEQVTQILELAGVAAHASKRTAAPVACWLAAKAGIDLGDAIAEATVVHPPAD